MPSDVTNPNPCFVSCGAAARIRLSTGYPAFPGMLVPVACNAVMAAEFAVPVIAVIGEKPSASTPLLVTKVPVADTPAPVKLQHHTCWANTGMLQEINALIAQMRIFNMIGPLMMQVL